MVKKAWVTGVAIAVVVAAFALWLTVRTDGVESAFRRSVDWSPTRVYAQSAGGELVEVDSYPDERGRRRDPVMIEELPSHLLDAVLHVEDRRFFDHGPVDLRRMASALFANLRAGRIVQGGSTITQQLARSLFLSRERTYLRKLVEVVSAWRLERRHTKRELLAAYLNEIYLLPGGTNPIHGVGLASRSLFGTPAANLDLAQSALLAGMIRAPSATDPRRHPEVARDRRDFVLRELHAAGRIDTDALEVALAQPLLPEAVVSDPPESARDFARLLRRRLAEELGNERADRSGLTLISTLDLELQAAAEESVRVWLEFSELRYPNLIAEPPLQAAMVVLSHDASVLALVGGRASARSEFDRASQARRQPGSAFKPLVLLTALSEPGSFTLASMINDIPLGVPLTEGTVWRPQNADEKFRGRVTLRYALEQSLNVPFARLGLAVGPERVVEMARRLGIKSPLAPMPSVSLGTFEVSPLELAQAYAVLAARGLRSQLRLVAVADGEPVARPAPVRVVDEGSAFLVTMALRGAVDRGSAAVARGLGYHGALAGKTGTTDDFRDAWFVGYTPELVVAVWVGFDDGRSLGEGAAELAVPIAAEFLRRTLSPFGRGQFRPPAGVVRARVYVKTPTDCQPVDELFVAGSIPADECSR